MTGWHRVTNGRRRMASGRTGAGLKRGWEPSPALVAERLARMQGAQRQAAGARAAAMRRLVEDASGMSLDDLRRAIPTRYWTVAMAHLGGYDDATIARSLGYATSSVVARVLRHPATRALIEKIQQEQLERVLEGTYGVQAQARGELDLNVPWPRVTDRLKQLGYPGSDETLTTLIEKRRRAYLHRQAAARSAPSGNFFATNGFYRIGSTRRRLQTPHAAKPASSPPTLPRSPARRRRTRRRDS